MTNNLSILLAAAALGLLAGCTTSPTSPSRSAAPPTATVGSSSQDEKTPAAPGLSAPLEVPDNLTGNFGTRQNQTDGVVLRELERGQASWYGPRFQGRRTASGERYDQHALTAAHKTLPFGTLVRVRSLVTGKEVGVRVNDRGPFARGRIIDVSRAAAEALGMMTLGVKPVVLLVAETGLPAASRPLPPAAQARRSDRPAAPAVSLFNSDTYPR